MSLPLDPTTRYVLRDDAKPSNEAHWFWPLPRLAGESPRIIKHANDERGGLDVGYDRMGFSELYVPVFAARSGTVSFAAHVKSGYAVTIDHGGVWATHYAHLDRMFVTPTLGRRRRRARVRAGEVIGYAAREPSHVRFELWKWSARDGFAPFDATTMMHKWLVLPQFLSPLSTSGPSVAA